MGFDPDIVDACLEEIKEKNNIGVATDWIMLHITSWEQEKHKYTNKNEQRIQFSFTTIYIFGII